MIMVTPAGFEPAIFWMRTKYPEPLDDGAVYELPQGSMSGDFSPETGDRVNAIYVCFSLIKNRYYT